MNVIEGGCLLFVRLHLAIFSNQFESKNEVIGDAPLLRGVAALYAISMSVLRLIRVACKRPVSCLTKGQHFSTVARGVREAQPAIFSAGQLSSPTEAEISYLTAFIADAKNLVVLTGAGISTSSGIPDYRGPNGSYSRGHKPMTHSEFMTKEASRKRFWARSMVGWQTVSDALPNNAHLALARLGATGYCQSVITQNVDRLHHKAGSTIIIDLHGRVDQVRCQCCQKTVSRKEWQHAMTTANADFMDRMLQLQLQQKLNLSSTDAQNTSLRADGDAELNLNDYSMLISFIHYVVATSCCFIY